MVGTTHLAQSGDAHKVAAGVLCVSEKIFKFDLPWINNLVFIDNTAVFCNCTKILKGTLQTNQRKVS